MSAVKDFIEAKEIFEREQLRVEKYVAALRHWQTVGYSYETARALAAVLHGADADVLAWAENIMLTQTNLKRSDMV